MKQESTHTSHTPSKDRRTNPFSQMASTRVNNTSDLFPHSLQETEEKLITAMIMITYSFNYIVMFAMFQMV